MFEENIAGYFSTANFTGNVEWNRSTNPFLDVTNSRFGDKGTGGNPLRGGADYYQPSLGADGWSVYR